MMNDWSVAKSKGYDDVNFQEAFEQFNNKDLLYFDDEFISCQVPEGKYAELKTSFDGTRKSGLLVTGNVNDQCDVRGSYYCMNNAWRQNIPGYDGDPSTFPEVGVALKQAPPGGNLVINGGFGD